MKETNKFLSSASTCPLHTSRDVAPLLLVSTVRKHFSFISHHNDNCYARQKLQASEMCLKRLGFLLVRIQAKLDDDDDDDEDDELFISCIDAILYFFASLAGRRILSDCWFWDGTVLPKVQSNRKRRILRGLLDILLFLRYLTRQGVYSHARHTSKAHAKHETKTKIVLVAADFNGITQLPLFYFVNPFLY